MYSEDMDLFYKAHLAGIPTIETDSVVIHHQGGTSRKVWSDLQRLERIEHSALIFARKFSLVFDYLVFKHLAFAKTVWKKPLWSSVVLYVLWKELILSSFRRPPEQKESNAISEA